MEIDVLIFDIEGQRFGVRAALVLEVLRAVTPMPLPGAPAVVMGMINLRGRVCPVLKTRELLGLSPVEVRHTDHLLVLRDDELFYALHVDHAVDLARLNIESAPPGHAHDSAGTGMLGLVAITEDRFAQVIEPSDLLGDEEKAGLLAIVSSQTASEISM